MKIAFKSDVGRMREINEDSIYCDPVMGLLIVADGMGGHLAGEVASSLAVKTSVGFIRDALDHGVIGPDPERTNLILRGAIEQANRTIREMADKDSRLHEMGTTIVLALSQGDQIHIAHVGDSRAYLFEESTLRRLTQDHSLVAEMVNAGQITLQEATTHHLRNYVMRSLGQAKPAQPDLRSVAWSAGTSVLLCSDGLTNMLNDRKIEKLLLRYGTDLERACNELVKAANAKGGQDNISVILAQQG